MMLCIPYLRPLPERPLRFLKRNTDIVALFGEIPRLRWFGKFYVQNKSEG